MPPYFRRRALSAALLLGLACHSSAQTAAPPAAEPPADPAALAARVHVYLIAPADGGHGGRRVACGDSAEPVEVALPQPAPALEGALAALLAMGTRYDRGSGLLNPLYASRLELAGIERHGAQLQVHLVGYVETGDRCDNARMYAELTETALQFAGISHVQFELDGQPLRRLLLGGDERDDSPEGHDGGDRRGGHGADNTTGAPGAAGGAPVATGASNAIGAAGPAGAGSAGVAAGPATPP